MGVTIMSNYDIFVELTKSVNYFNNLYTSLNIKDEEQFHSNRKNIDLSIHAVSEISNVAREINYAIIELVSDLADILIPLINYSNNLVSKYGTSNTYKLYDFMSIELPRLAKILENIEK